MIKDWINFILLASLAGLLMTMSYLILTRLF